MLACHACHVPRPNQTDHTDTHSLVTGTEVCDPLSGSLSALYAHRPDTVSAVPPPCAEGQTPRSQPTSPPGVRLLSLKGRQLKGVAGVAFSFHVGWGGRPLQQPQQHLLPRSLSHVQPPPQFRSPAPVRRAHPPQNYYRRSAESSCSPDLHSTPPTTAPAPLPQRLSTLLLPHPEPASRQRSQAPGPLLPLHLSLRRPCPFEQQHHQALVAQQALARAEPVV